MTAVTVRPKCYVVSVCAGCQCLYQASRRDQMTGSFSGWSFLSEAERRYQRGEFWAEVDYQMITLTWPTVEELAAIRSGRLPDSARDEEPPITEDSPVAEIARLVRVGGLKNWDLLEYELYEYFPGLTSEERARGLEIAGDFLKLRRSLIRAYWVTTTRVGA